MYLGRTRQRPLWYAAVKMNYPKIDVFWRTFTFGQLCFTCREALEGKEAQSGASEAVGKAVGGVGPRVRRTFCPLQMPWVGWGGSWGEGESRWTPFKHIVGQAGGGARHVGLDL